MGNILQTIFFIRVAGGSDGCSSGCRDDVDDDNRDANTTLEL